MTQLLFALSAALAIVAGDDRQAADLARQILDDSKPATERQSIIDKHPEVAAELVAALAAGLSPNDQAEEYRRIPWIWRVAVAAGKRNDGQQLKKLLEVSLPKEGERLRDWQAVVIGGGIINGISQSGAWPHERIGELLKDDKALAARWKRALTEAATMADNEEVRTGTRYDALRMIALDSTYDNLLRLAKYMSKETNAELQMGAVSGLSDFPSEKSAGMIMAHIANLTPQNRSLALDALLRSEERAKLLVAAIERGRIPAEWLSELQRKKLREQPSKNLRQRAAKILP
jgi:hypothetical protein